MFTNEKEFNGKGKFNNFPNYLIELHRKNVGSGFKAVCLRFAPSVYPFWYQSSIRVILFSLCPHSVLLVSQLISFPK